MKPYRKFRLKTSEAPRHGLKGLLSIVTVTVVLGGILAATPASAAMPNCTVVALLALNVPNMTVTSATDVAPSGLNPEFCDVRGSVTTIGNGVPNGSAGFPARLPANWNGKFLFFGVGGLAGNISPSANGVDVRASLVKGYATAITDAGHQAGGTDASWALMSPGVPDTTKLTDYYYRAAHDVTVAAKRLVRAFFNADIQRSYFDGCSNGGRMAFVEATRFPEDYDGIIAGAPFLDIRVIIGGVKNAKQFLTPSTYIPAALLPMVDQAIYASCDAADGVTDGLIQNPATCSFNPDTLVCTAANPTCLTQGQADTLKTYFAATRDQSGRLIYTGFAVSDLHGAGMDLWSTGFVPPIDFTANEPWGDAGFSPASIAWQFVDHIVKFIIERDPTFDVRDFDVSTDGVVSDRALALFDRRTEAGDGDVPGKLIPFIIRNKKLLIYHGFSDPALPPFRTVTYYEDLARITGGYRELQENVRLFMVPGMQHCGGGPGPNVFDTLTPLENWVEHGVAPNGIIASHFANNVLTNPVDRTMPLCKFPGQARYTGTGNVNDAANWTCSPNRRLLEVAPNGVEAGLGGHGHDGEDEHDD